MKHKPSAVGSGAGRAAPVKSMPPAVEPAATEDDRETQIREAAYFRYLARGAIVGHEMEDWLQAEAELLEEAGKADDTNH